MDPSWPELREALAQLLMRRANVSCDLQGGTSLGLRDSAKCVALRAGTQEPRKVNKTQNTKRKEQERVKSQTAEEAGCPTVRPPIAQASPLGLPGLSVSPPCASHGGDEAELADTPWDWIQTRNGWQQWGHFCKGGGGEQSELLSGLQELLARIKKPEAANSQAKGKGSKAANPRMMQAQFLARLPLDMQARARDRAVGLPVTMS